MAVAAILLAAGRSERMGRQKALIGLDGVPLLEYQLAQLSAIDAIRQIIVVTGHAADRLRPTIGACAKAREAHNAEYDAGKAGSVRCGIADVADPADDILLAAVDQPRPVSIIARLLDEHVRTRALITQPVHHGRRGHPIVFAAGLRSELAGVDEASQGVRAVLARHEGDLHAVTFDDAIVLVDVNTPEDVEAARRLLATG